MTKEQAMTIRERSLAKVERLETSMKCMLKESTSADTKYCVSIMQNELDKTNKVLAACEETLNF